MQFMLKKGSDPTGSCYKKSVFRIRIQLNPDPNPAKNLNPDPEDLESGSGSEKKIKLLHNYKIFSSKEVN